MYKKWAMIDSMNFSAIDYRECDTHGAEMDVAEVMNALGDGFEN